MKEIKKRADKDRQKILAEDTFLEDVLLPMVNEGNRGQTVKRKRIKKAVFITSPLVAVAIIVCIVLGVLLTPNTYLGQPVTATSDLTTLNQCLINTQVNGEFDLILATYNDETLEYYLFEANMELITEEAMITFSMFVLIDRDFPYAVGVMYASTNEFLGYLIEVTEEVAEILYEGIPVKEFTVNAYLDTGNECFCISYKAITTNDESGFAEFLNNTIIKK